MPYLPGMFLAYLPPKLLGVDLRLSNLVLDVATVVIAIKYAAGTAGRSVDPRRPACVAANDASSDVDQVQCEWPVRAPAF